MVEYADGRGHGRHGSDTDPVLPARRWLARVLLTTSITATLALWSVGVVSAPAAAAAADFSGTYAVTAKVPDQGPRCAGVFPQTMTVIATDTTLTIDAGHGPMSGPFDVGSFHINGTTTAQTMVGGFIAAGTENILDQGNYSVAVSDPANPDVIAGTCSWDFTGRAASSVAAAVPTEAAAAPVAPPLDQAPPPAEPAPPVLPPTAAQPAPPAPTLGAASPTDSTSTTAPPDPPGIPPWVWVLLGLVLVSVAVLVARRLTPTTGALDTAPTSPDQPPADPAVLGAAVPAPPGADGSGGTVQSIPSPPPLLPPAPPVPDPPSDTRVLSGQGAAEALWNAMHPAGPSYDPNIPFTAPMDLPPGIPAMSFTTRPDGTIDTTKPVGVVVPWPHPAASAPTVVLEPPPGGFTPDDLRTRLTSIGLRNPQTVTSPDGTTYVRIPENLPPNWQAFGTEGKTIDGHAVFDPHKTIVVAPWPTPPPLPPVQEFPDTKALLRAGATKVAALVDLVTEWTAQATSALEAAAVDAAFNAARSTGKPVKPATWGERADALRRANNNLLQATNEYGKAHLDPSVTIDQKNAATARFRRAADEAERAERAYREKPPS